MDQFIQLRPQGIATPVLTIEWDAADKSIAYDVEWRRDDLNWVRVGRVGTTSCEVRGIYAGKYLARVRAVNALNAVSQPTLSMLTDITGNGNERPPGTKWTNVGDAIAESGALVGRMNQVEMDIGELDGKVLAQGKRIDGIFAQVDARGAGDTDGGAGDATAYAGVMSVQAVAAMDDYAMAKRTDTVEAKVGDTQAIVQQTSQAVVDIDGKISASWNLKLQIAANGQYYAAGMGIGIENQPDGSYQSQILFQADRLALINVINDQVTTPFVIQGGQTFISQALIGVAWITNANIADAAITNAKISGVIQSDDYAQGQTGWRINKAAGGGFEFNGTVAGGYRLNITNQGIYIRYPNGNLAVELGVLL